jgi:uncharacterized membrane protein
MKEKSNKLPIDIAICLIWSLIFIFIALLDIENSIRVFFGVPFMLFISGYILLFALYPEKEIISKISLSERLIISIGISIAITSLIGLAINYTPLRIFLEPFLLVISIFILTITIIGLYRWYLISSKERYIPRVNLYKIISKNKVNFLLNIGIIISIIIASLTFIYLISNQENNERFTSFYILNSNEKAINYPTEINIGEETDIFVGVSNHEKETINYTIEIWISNETFENGKILYKNFWFINKIEFSLKHKEIEIGEKWLPQYKKNLSLIIEEEELKGENLKINLLLFKGKTELHEEYNDYYENAEEIMDNVYRNVFLIVDIL